MDQLNIYIDQLQDDEAEQIDEKIDAMAFDIHEKELNLEGKVAITGSAYCTKEHLILSLNIKATASVPCNMCNQNFPLSIRITGFSQTIALNEIQGAIFNLRDEIRAAIILKIPHFSECHDGQCPMRTELSSFLKQESNLPFSELTL